MIWKVASRYFIGRKSTNAINIISWVSISAIAVGAASLIIVLSVFNGFEDLVKSLYSSFYPEIKISPYLGKTMLVPVSKLQAIKGLPGVRYISEVIQEKAVLSYNNGHTIAVLMGVDDYFSEVTGIQDKIVRGKFETGDADTPFCVVGTGIEANLGIDIEKNFYPLTAYVPKQDIGTITDPEEALNSGNINPVGAFAIQQDFDNTYVITNIGFMRLLTGMNPREVSSLDLRLTDPSQMDQISSQIRRLLGNSFQVQTRYQQNESLYRVMQTEKWVVYAILSFILAIAAFNMIGSLYMLVIDKARDIAILKAMGSTDWLIRKIFLTEGLLIAGTGALIGGILAVAVCLIQIRFGLVKLEGDSFVINAYPVSMKAMDFGLVFVTIGVIAILASWYPAARASRQPLELKAQ